MYPYPYPPFGDPATNSTNPPLPIPSYPVPYPYYPPPGYPPLIPSSYPVHPPGTYYPSSTSSSIASYHGSSSVSNNSLGYPPAHYILPSAAGTTGLANSSGVPRESTPYPHNYGGYATSSSSSSSLPPPSTTYPSSTSSATYSHNNNYNTTTHNPTPSFHSSNNKQYPYNNHYPHQHHNNRSHNQRGNHNHHHINTISLPTKYTTTEYTHPHTKKQPQQPPTNNNPNPNNIPKRGSTTVSSSSSAASGSNTAPLATTTSATTTTDTLPPPSSSSSSSSSSPLPPFTCCKKTFSTERDLFLHKAFHIPCPIENCTYEGIRNRIAQHLSNDHHRKIEEFADRIPKLPVPLPRKEIIQNTHTTNEKSTNKKLSKPKETSSNKESTEENRSNESNTNTLPPDASEFPSETLFPTDNNPTDSNDTKKMDDFPVERDQDGNIIIPSSLVKLIPPQYRSAAQIGNTEEEITRWRAERKRNFPTETNIVNKQQRLKKQQENGQWTANPDTGKMKIPNKRPRTMMENTENTKDTDNNIDNEDDNNNNDDDAPEELTSTVNAVHGSNPLSSTTLTNLSSEGGPSSPRERRDSNRKQEVCRRFLAGNCRNGNHCHYAHSRNTASGISSMDNYNGLIQPVPHSSLSRSLLHKLLAKDIEIETSTILQCLTYIVRNNFLQEEPSSSSSSLSVPTTTATAISYDSFGTEIKP